MLEQLLDRVTALEARLRPDLRRELPAGLVQDVLQVEAGRAAVSLRAPRLPAFIEWLELRELRAGAGTVDLLLQRYDENVGVRVLRKSGPIEVHVAV